jgi:hypothetical protein
MKIAIHTPTELQYKELTDKLSNGRNVSVYPFHLAYGEDTVVEYDTHSKDFYITKKFMAEKPIIPYSDLKANTFKIEIQL